MKEIMKALAVHSRVLAKCVAIAVYIIGGTGYLGVQQVLETFVKPEKMTNRRYIRRLTVDIFFSILYY